MKGLEVLETLLWEFGHRVYDKAWTPIGSLDVDHISNSVQHALLKMGCKIKSEESLGGGFGPVYMTVEIDMDEITFLIDDYSLKVHATTDVTFTVAHLLEGERSIENMLLLYNYIKIARISTVEVSKHMWSEGFRCFADWHKKFASAEQRLMRDLGKFHKESIFGGDIPRPSWLELKYTILAFMYNVYS